MGVRSSMPVDMARERHLFWPLRGILAPGWGGVSGNERAFIYSYDGVNRYTSETYAERATTNTTAFPASSANVGQRPARLLLVLWDR